jgi:hypothetical protein
LAHRIAEGIRTADVELRPSSFANRVVLSAQAIAMAGHDLVVDGQTELSVCLPSGGSDEEVLALAHLLPDLAPRVRRLQVTVRSTDEDRAAIRATVMEHAAQAWRSAGDDRALGWTESRTADELVEVSSRADLVILRQGTDASIGTGPFLSGTTRHRPASQRILVISEASSTPHSTVTEPDLPDGSSVLHTATIDVPAPEPLVSERGRLPRSGSDPSAPRRLRARMLLLGTPAAAPIGEKPTDDQRRALDAFAAFLRSDDRVFLLRGPAGTGKTFLFRLLIAAAQRSRLGSSLMAPTGAAAQRLRDRVGRPGATVHSTIYTFDRVRQVEIETQPSFAEDLGVVPEGEDDADGLLPVAVFRRGEPPVESLLHIVDEASLIGDAERDPDEPTEVEFGEGRVLSDLMWFALRADGSRIVLAGDHLQLPPVDDPDAPALDPGTYEERGIGATTYDLSENVRHRTSPSLGALARRLMAELDASTTGRDVDVILGDASGDGIVRRTGDPFEVVGLLDQVASLDATIVTYRNVDVARWNRVTRERLSRPSDRPAAGDRLLVVRTDHDRGIYNGSEVEVVDVADEPEIVTIRRESVHLWPTRVRVDLAQGLEVQVSLLLVGDTLERAHRDDLLRVTRILTADFFRRTRLKRNDPKLAAFAAHDDCLNALRAQYAYARTCHRAQGGEWDRVVVDRSRLPSVELRWFYTAVTRARQEAIILDPTEVSRSIDIDEAAEDLVAQLAADGITVVSHRQVQDGLQLTVRPSASTGLDVTSRLNVYWRSGRPSSVVLTGKDTAGIGGTAKACIAAWIEEVVAAASPVSADVAETVARLTARCAEVGILLESQGRGPYLVAMTARRGEVTCRTEWHHDSRGRFTKAAHDRHEGDPELLAEMTGMISSVE